MTEVRIALAPCRPLHAADRETAPPAPPGLPARVKLLNWGRNETTEGVVIVDDLTARVFAANQKKIGRERVPVDFEHNTVPGTPEYERTREPRAVAGHSALVCVPGQGIFGEAITYTAAARNFEDASLAPFLDRAGRVIAAHSWALTHAGAATGINFAEAKTLRAELTTLSATETPAHPMDNNPAPALTLADLAELLELPATAEKPAVLAALKARLNPAPAAAAATAATAAAPAAADLAPLAAKLTALEGELATLRTADTLARRAELAARFAREGRVPRKTSGEVYGAGELQALDLPTLQLLHANTPVTVALSARTGAHPAEAGKNFKNKDGLVDLAALFDAENQQRGVQAPNASPLVP